MNDEQKFPDDKSKPFRLVKYFTFSSLIVIFIGTILLSFLNTHFARTMHIKKSEDYAVLLVENINHQVFLQFVIPVILKYGKIQLRNSDQFERLDHVIRSTIHSFKIESLNIYDLNNIISYSLNQEIVGKKGLGGKAYQHALEGKTSSEVIQIGTFIEIMIGIPRESKIVTFAPLRAERPLTRISGPVLGVVEISQNLSDDYKTIFKFQILVMTTSTIVMGFIFLVLLMLVKRGERIIHQRNLEQLQLREQLHRAERLSALGEMVAAISHEIRNPLGIIRSSSELLKKKVHQYEPNNSIPDIIIEESNRLNQIITDFLDYAKPRIPRLAPCRVEDILEKNLNFLDAQMKSHQITVEKQFESNIPEIMADASILYQAFLNIIINAMQAMPDGGQLLVKIHSTPTSVIVGFHDTGHGIPEEIIPKIWDPFFTTRDTGTGLGLGIVKNIVESHHGTISVSNRNPKGTSVEIELPVNGLKLQAN